MCLIYRHTVSTKHQMYYNRSTLTITFITNIRTPLLPTYSNIHMSRYHTPTLPLFRSRKVKTSLTF